MKHLIIGAGITGLYLAYKLLSQGINSNDIILFEKSDRIGGRIYTYENSGYKYSVGAGRLGKKHKYVMKLIIDFNLEDQMIDINKTNNYFVDGKLMNEQQLLRHYKSQYKSLNDLWRYAIEKKVNNKYDLSKLLKYVVSRYNRCSFERVIACILQKEQVNEVLFGDIFKYCDYGTPFDRIGRYAHLPMIKCWTGR
jgi:protoporphyrinogen oxidase